MSEVEQDIHSEPVDVPVPVVDVPVEQIADVPSEIPVPVVDVPVEPTSDVPVEIPVVDVPVEQPVDVPSEIPVPVVDVPVEQPVDVPSEIPVVDVPVEQPVDVPSEIPVVDVPVEQIADVPSEIPVPVVDVPVEQIADVPSEIPVPVVDVPVEQIADVPVEQIADVPVEQIADVPVEQPVDVPSEIPVPVVDVPVEPEVKLDEIYASTSDVQEEDIVSNENITAVISEVQPPQPTPIPESTIPNIIFIVPYRDREKHYKLFSSVMKDALVNSPPHQIFYINQKDNRGFNRGAMKNIGFLAVKNMYPNDYQNITLVFNDIDTMPAKDTVLNYQTTRGIIKHFYGFDHTLGGIVSINASDFESLNGFPNFWAWGYEDNLLQNRAKNAGIVIDRSVFYKIFDSHIIHLSDSPMRTVNRAEFDRFLQNTNEGIDSIKDLNYTFNADTGFIDVLQFNTTVQETVERRSEYDLRNGPVPFKEFIMKNRRAPRMKMHF